MLKGTMRAVGATRRSPARTFSGHRTGWRGLYSPTLMMPEMMALLPHRATAGRPYSGGRDLSSHNQQADDIGRSIQIDAACVEGEMVVLGPIVIGFVEFMVEIGAPLIFGRNGLKGLRRR